MAKNQWQHMREQVLSWFRNDAPTCDEMKELRHKHILFYHAERHNEALLHGQPSYLRSVEHARQKKVIYII